MKGWGRRWVVKLIDAPLYYCLGEKPTLTAGMTDSGPGDATFFRQRFDAEQFLTRLTPAEAALCEIKPVALSVRFAE